MNIHLWLHLKKMKDNNAQIKIVYIATYDKTKTRKKTCFGLHVIKQLYILRKI